MAKPSALEPVKLRSAHPGDASAIAALGATVFADSFGYSMPLADLNSYLETSYSPASISQDLDDSNKDTVVACPANDEARVIGFVVLTRGTTEPCLSHLHPSSTVELQRLYISPNYHRRGIARLLVNHVEEMARKQGFKTMWLGVWEENFRAQGVYKRMGYVKVGNHDFVIGTCRQTDWIMVKDL